MVSLSAQSLCASLSCCLCHPVRKKKHLKSVCSFVFFHFFREGHRDVLSPLFQGGLLGPNPVSLWAKARVQPG